MTNTTFPQEARTVSAVLGSTELSRAGSYGVPHIPS